MFIISRSLHGQICIPVSKFHCKQSTVSRSTGMHFVTADFNDLVRVTNFTSLSLSLSGRLSGESQTGVAQRKISKDCIFEKCRPIVRSVNSFPEIFLKTQVFVYSELIRRLRSNQIDKSNFYFILFFFSIYRVPEFKMKESFE